MSDEINGPGNDEAATPDPDAPKGTIAGIDLDEEIQDSYLGYAMSVIGGRALPDVCCTRCTPAAPAPTAAGTSARASSAT